MITIPGVARKKIAVYGLGATGLAVCKALDAAGADVFTWDENKTARAQTENSTYAAEHPKHWPWTELSSLVLSPGVPLTHPKPHPIVRKARAEKVEIIGDIELFARALNALDEKARPTIVAVTGSNGKSTTTALIHHILRETGRDAVAGGNLGEPLLAMPDFEAARAYVLELSSFQLDLAETLRADIAIHLNLTADHLDRHGSMEGYAAAKRRIFRNQTAKDTAIVGVDDEYSQTIFAGLCAEKIQNAIPISAGGALGHGVFWLEGRLYYSLHEKTGEAGDLRGIDGLRGAHNGQNAAAALAAVMQLGVAPAVAIRAMARYQTLPHRMERVGDIGKAVFINDSKATNADAAAKALSSYNDIFWIAGGKPKEGGVASLRPLMPRVRGVYLIGEAARDFEASLAGSAPCFQCGDLAAAVSRAARDAAQSDIEKPVVLLSPACASYDQFKNFEERGEAFRDLVRRAAKDAKKAKKAKKEGEAA